jgi:hypothetical protein
MMFAIGDGADSGLTRIGLTVVSSVSARNRGKAQNISSGGGQAFCGFEADRNLVFEKGRGRIRKAIRLEFIGVRRMSGVLFEFSG